MCFSRYARPLVLAALAVFFSAQSRATEFAVSQYGRVTATLPWAVALEKGLLRRRRHQDRSHHFRRGRRHHAAEYAGERSALRRSRDLGGAWRRSAPASTSSSSTPPATTSARSRWSPIRRAAFTRSRISQGKKAGFTNPKSTSELLLRLALKEAGMTGKVEMVGNRRLRRRSHAARQRRHRCGAADRSDPDAQAGQISRHLSFRRPHPAHDLAGRRDHAQIRHGASGHGAQADRGPSPRRRLHLRASRRGDPRSMPRSGNRSPRTSRRIFPSISATRASGRRAASTRRRWRRCPMVCN